MIKVKSVTVKVFWRRLIFSNLTLMLRWNDTGYRPYPVFNAMWEDSGGRSGLLGYPTGPAVTDRNYDKQYFERGFLCWSQSPFTPEPVWVVVIPDPAASRGSTWMQYDNAWDSGSLSSHLTVQRQPSPWDLWPASASPGVIGLV